MNKIFYPSESRGYADHGWLQAKHTFSFARYYDPERMGFGLLRVVNDDIIAPSKGFAPHSHDNMEIISIPLAGALAHKDNTGGEGVIRHGEVQVMSAGRGVEHSEFNLQSDAETNLLQIWILPKELNIHPRYEQAKFSIDGRKNKIQFVVSPLGSDHAGLKINQDAYFALSDVAQDEHVDYELQQEGNGLFVMNIEGEFETLEENLQRRDALGVQFDHSENKKVTVSANSDSQVLFIEVPMS